MFSTILDLGLKLGQRTGFEALVRYETDMVFLKEMRYTTELGHHPLKFAMEMHPEFLLPVKKLAIKLQRFSIVDFDPDHHLPKCFWAKLAAACPVIKEVVFDTEGLIYWDNGNISVSDRNRLAAGFPNWLVRSYERAKNAGILKNLTVLTDTSLDKRQEDSQSVVESCSESEDSEDDD